MNLSSLTPILDRAARERQAFEHTIEDGDLDTFRKLIEERGGEVSVETQADGFADVAVTWETATFQQEI